MATSPHNERPPILRLSQEIIDEIIDHVPKHKDLMSLSLVCQALRPRCEKHLFTSIRFSNIASSWSRKTGRFKFKDFIDILFRKPYIAGYIRELHLGVGYGRDPELTVEDPGFLKIMDLIGESANGFRIKRVELAGSRTGPTRKIANPRRFAESLCAPFTTPFLSSLCIKDLDDVPITLVTGCPNLKSLDLIRTTFGGPDLVNINSASQSYPQLQRLGFHRCTQGIDTLMQRQVLESHPFLNLSKLKIITTDRTWIDNVVALTGLLQVSSGSLEELHLKFVTDHDVKVLSGTEQLNLDTLIHLRVLHVDTFVEGGLLRWYPDDLPCVCKLLNTISSPNVLEDLTINIFLENGLTRPTELERTNLAYLDHEVRRLSSGKSLKFHLNFFYNTTTYLDGYGYELDGDDDDEEDRYFNSSGYPENGGPVTTLDYTRALKESTFRKIIERQLPMIRSDPNIILYLKIDPGCRPSILKMPKRNGSYMDSVL